MSDPFAHILHVSGHLAGEPLAFLSQATRELTQAGVGQTVLHPVAEPAGPELHAAASLPERVRCVELAGSAAGPLAFARDLPGALQTELDSGRYTAVHFHGPLVGLIGGIAMATAALPHRPPVYYSPHTPLSPAAFLQRAVGAMVLRPVASGTAEAHQLKRLTRREAFALDAAVDPEFFDVQRAADSAEPLVVSMGHARADSGTELFADLSARFHFAGEPARFVWIGPCEAAARELLLAAGVLVTGWLPDAQVRSWLARARVYVQTSRWRKTPRSLLQAMACGTPCLATDVPAHREVLRHGDTGMLGGDVSSLALTLKTLLDDPTLNARLGGAARQDAHHRFTLPRLRQSLLTLYGLVPGERSAAAAWMPGAVLASGS